MSADLRYEKEVLVWLDDAPVLVTIEYIYLGEGVTGIEVGEMGRYETTNVQRYISPIERHWIKSQYRRINQERRHKVRNIFAAARGVA